MRASAKHSDSNAHRIARVDDATSLGSGSTAGLQMKPIHNGSTPVLYVAAQQRLDEYGSSQEQPQMSLLTRTDPEVGVTARCWNRRKGRRDGAAERGQQASSFRLCSRSI